MIPFFRLTGFLSLALKGGPRYGVDFSGGLLVQVRFSAPIEPDRIKDLLSGLKMESVTVQQFGDSSNEFLIRSQHVQEDMAHFAEKIERVLKVGSGDENLVGGDVINGFAFTLLVGIIAGTYSPLATPMVPTSRISP